MGWSSNNEAHIVWTYETGPRYLCLISLQTFCETHAAAKPLKEEI